ncbi:ribosome small subunit-dependent GTPase A [Cryptosporangium phraense]|uniref:ribosome small subunit-dependent GTPase A n=1 Tax=Cryptosporangium phraense TaxID=2593070 RepID=UPI001F0D34F2|nr:ribosome small subunit-dependent GTPase A [Cryptosporangium phraense]
MDRSGECPLSPRRDLDEDDVRVRARPGSRPRTRTRPTHADAREALVVGVDRGRYTCWLDDREVTAMRARELGRKSVVVGDRVALVGDVSGGPDALARIVRIAERRSVLRRTADDDDPYERVIVANADQLVVVTALVDPPPRTGFVDRCLVAAFDAQVDPLLCLTKADLAPKDAADEFRQHWAALDLPVVTTRRDEEPTELEERLTGRMSVLIGHSGVGKSTLVNRLVPDAERATGGLSAIGKGRHTSTSAVALALPGGGWVIDTPGVRSFGLAHVSPASVLAGFPDLAPGAADCPPNCEHRSAEEGCALDAWVEAGHASPERLASYRRLLESRSDLG